MAASGPNNTKILQFDWSVSGRLRPMYVAHTGEESKKILAFCRIKIKIFDKIWNENVFGAIIKGKVTMSSQVGEEILHEMTTELQVVI